MRRFIDIVRNLFETQALFEMANLSPSETGVPYVIFVSQKGGAKHDARVKVGKSIKFHPRNVSTIALRPIRVIGTNPFTTKEYEQIVMWLNLNMDTLIAYWNGETTTKELLDTIQSI